jgi:hypothetical protein
MGKMQGKFMEVVMPPGGNRINPVHNTKEQLVLNTFGCGRCFVFCCTWVESTGVHAYLGTAEFLASYKPIATTC